jgi:phage-related protein
MVRLDRLEELGHELRRPEVAYLRDGIYEVRAKHGGVSYRMLYFFHGRTAAVVSAWHHQAAGGSSAQRDRESRAT